MLFQVYGDNAIYQWIGWILVFCCLIGANELARRTKTGGVIAFLVIPAVLTVYFITIYTAAAMGADWALNNPTYVHMTSWFHYAKLYAATSAASVSWPSNTSGDPSANRTGSSASRS